MTAPGRKPQCQDSRIDITRNLDMRVRGKRMSHSKSLHTKCLMMQAQCNNVHAKTEDATLKNEQDLWIFKCLSVRTPKKPIKWVLFRKKENDDIVLRLIGAAWMVVYCYKNRCCFARFIRSMSCCAIRFVKIFNEALLESGPNCYFRTNENVALLECKLSRNSFACNETVRNQMEKLFVCK